MIISLALLPAVPATTHAAAGGFSESLSVYVAGSNAAWFLSIGNVNVSNPYVASVESIPGVISYNLTAIDTTSWTSDFQVFGAQGYNVIPVPFVPLQGAFLNVVATSYPDASLAASRFGSYLVTSFRSYSNSSGAFTFFAPLEFDLVAPPTLLSFFPFRSAGFTLPLNASGFEKLPSQLVTLGGSRGPSGFAHEITLSSIVSSALNSNSRPDILGYFGSSPRFIQASNRSSASTITIHSLDGVISSPDNATVASDRRSFTGSYTLHLRPGERVYGLNATILQQPAQLLATRIIDVGVLTPGSNMSVTLSLTNLSNSTTITAINVADNWWKSSGLLRLVSGSSNVTSLSLEAGHSSTPTYVLQYIDKANATGALQIPATLVSYAEISGGEAFQWHTALNPITISLGVDEPVVYGYLAPSGGLGKGVGTTLQLKAFVKNVGTRTATSVEIAGQQLGGLAPSESTSATIPVAAASLTSVNLTKSFQVTYVTPEGATANASTNSFPVIFSHDKMDVAFVTFKVNSTMNQLPSGGWSLNLTMDFANGGSGKVTSFTAESQLPAGLSCGRAGGKNLTCADGALSLHYSGVIRNGQEHAWMQFNVTQARNYIFWPFATSVATSGLNLTAYSNAQPAPTGILISKQFSPSPLFVGMSSTVTVLASNAGPFNLYNATVNTVADSFDQAASNARTTDTAGNITAGSDLNFTYGVKAVSASRNSPSTAVTSSFYFGGTRFSLLGQGPKVSVFAPLSASVTTSPSNPTEGRSFEIVVKVSNPATVAVSNVQFFLPIPSGIALSNPVNATLSGGGLTISAPQLGAGATYSAEVNVTANSGQTIPFAGTTLSFGYAGATVTGKVPTAGIAVSENVVSRYELPVGLVILALLATAFYVRRMAGASAPASQS
jgi:hypothetical protein